MAHAAGDIAAFTDGETRLVYAAHVNDPIGPLYLLEDNTAKQFKSYAKANLQCFIPDCATPQFTTVSRARGRDGFRHLTGGGHSEESLFHKQGKHALLDWLARKHPDVDARPEVSMLPVVDRRADVLATHATGERIALEVQYSAMPAPGDRDSWESRTRDYQNVGVSPVWFLGHRGVHFKPQLGGETIELGPVARAILDAGMQLWWLNPILGVVAIPYVVDYVEREGFLLAPTSQDRTVYLWIEPIDSLTLTATGPHHPRLDELAYHRVAYLAAEQIRTDREEQRRATAVAKAERDKAHAADRQRRANERAVQKQRKVSDAIEAQNTAWSTSTMRANVLARYGGQIPEHLDLPSSSSGIRAHRQHWQALAYGHLMFAKLDSIATINDCLRVLSTDSLVSSRVAAGDTIRDWLQRLHALGHVDLVEGTEGRFTVTDPPRELLRREVRAERLRTEQARRLEQERRERQVAAKQRRHRREQAWLGSPLRAVVIERFSGLPELLTLGSSNTDNTGVDVALEHWRALAAIRIADLAPRFGIEDCVASIKREVPVTSVGSLRTAIRDWLLAAQHDGWVLALPLGRYLVQERFTSLDAAPPPPPAPPIVRDVVGIAGQIHLGPVATHCRICHRPLDEFLATQGVTTHTGCAEIPGRSVGVPAASRRGRLRTCKGCANTLPTGLEGAYHDGCTPWEQHRVRHQLMESEPRRVDETTDK
ncbi:hypothetical protein HP550_17555 [Cellulomonas humilata]|uniref:Competence protein CoiA nuclease-like domain-containing protein n=1 Tax=Cellulomonas humilata TaxID=144055 RepID=A0A7Y6DYW9_9CELL|nr:competence protein CoiA family protein [Cellulomonas humilata]NUU19058.1 hypothetical protein [Cellulomonas humilata]